MKLWFSACIVIIGFSCFEADNRSSNQKCKTNVYAKKFREESSENEVDSDPFSFPDTDSGGTSDSDHDEYDYEDCSIHDRMELGGSSDPNGFTDCRPSQPINCDPNYGYRTMNGSCNNLLYPLWGASNQCFRRYYPAYYTGFGNFRTSVTGASLPQPRQLSLNIFQNRYRPTEDLSFMFTIYGQTVAHDISLSDFESPSGDSARCCVPENENDSACINIQISEDDPFYSQYGVTCLDMFRTVACTACNTTKRQQNTGQTAAMDASIVYGPDDNTARGLRVTDGTGRLRSNYTKKGELLPSGNNPNDVFCPMLQKYPCFNAGDPRVNQHATLTSMQTVFMREHNRIAEELLELNPNWNDERLYQEARRINIAQLQYINYQEYLPYLLGQYYMSEFDLWVQRGSGGTRYNPYVEYGAWNEFSTVAFRLHSMTATDVGALNLQFRNLYSNPALLWQGHLGEILNGVCTVPSENFDRWYVYDVTDFLFQRSGIPFGSDLASLDVQRGRDHGIAPYVYYVYYCSDGDVDIQSFDDLVYYRIISQNDSTLLQQNYARVQDIDLYVGLQLEYHSRGAKVGPTTACIIARQFYHLKYGDRFYFEHIGEAGSFTADITKKDEIENARKIVESKLGDNGLNLLINNAGALKGQGFLNITEENMVSHFTTNAVGPVLVLKEMLPLLQNAASRKTSGMDVSRAAVLNISSMGGSIGELTDESPKKWLEILGYRTSKTALNMAMRVIAFTVKDQGILIVNMCPGWVKTDMGSQEAQLTTEESISAMLKTLSQLNESHHGTFLDRNGKTILF